MLTPLQQLINQINAELPQTQCEKCGFKGCLPYAQALAEGESEINRCPPGGQAVINKLSNLLNRPALALNESCGTYQHPQVVKIIEKLCIGCTKCIQACPVNAIVGAKKWMHTIISADCTGCELCIPVCPLDCIDIVEISNYQAPDQNQVGLDDWMRKRAINAQRNLDMYKARLAKRSRVTATVLPQMIKLAESSDILDMKNFINNAKQKSLEKYQSQLEKHHQDNN